MKTSLLFKLSMAFGVAAFAAGCAAPSKPVASHHPAHPVCPPHSHLYKDTAHHYRLCLPNGVTTGDASAYPAGSTVFKGFALPTGTNLQDKKLVFIPGTDPDVVSGTASGHLTAGGVTFKRVKFDEGSAGHSTLHIIYTGKHAGKTLNFDFTHYAANVLNFPPQNRPHEYNRAHQLHLSEEIMHTFQPLP